MRNRYTPVHPHACGEHTPCATAHSRMIGSSPRLWGTCLATVVVEDAQRFIPTPVGNIRPCRDGCHCRSVHPHACGEHDLALVIPGPHLGSSPRLWGTYAAINRLVRDARFIPTPVGNIRSSAPGLNIAPVHPHACGEHSVPFSFAVLLSGSSPRLWGTCPRFVIGLRQARFIPTPVGNISPCRLLASAYPVHPHACGEHYFNAP